MALPKLNQAPVYNTKIPSTGQSIQYRPFLVKEQKILLMALETNDEKQVLTSIYELLKNCIISDCNIDNLALFDIEYIFLQLRGKAVGENSDIKLKCTKCESENDVRIALGDLYPDIKEVNTKIKIGEEYILNLQYPKFGNVIEANKEESDIFTEDAPKISTIYELSLQCLESLDTDDEKILFKDESATDKEEFMGSLTSGQFEDIITFVQAIPKLEYDVAFECTGCKHKNEYHLEGMQDFF
jgi:hypothetical protein